MERLLSDCLPAIAIAALVSLGTLPLAGASPVTVCVALSRSADLDNLTISVRGVLSTTIEGWWLRPESQCAAQVFDGRTMQNSLIVMSANGYIKAFKYRVALPTDQPSIDRLWEAEKRCRAAGRHARVVLHGRFEGYPYFVDSSKPRPEKYGFGQQFDFVGQLIFDRVERIMGCVAYPGS
jgi:hypothetical protein